ncbi:Cyclin-A1 [Larimichthys crocea]|uniref:G2/mitotic-specific cyclin-B2 n=1 Tax=Larimichthys crocea TaxID=215358 RepID=A0A6G0I7M0_LARCR|nr:Cyclin-A1 [Larimichthys crocea]
MAMDLSTNAHCSSHTSKENILPSNKTNALQLQRAKQRTVLGVMSENEQHGRSFNQESYISKHSSFSDSSQLAFHGCASSSGYDVYVEEACEVVLAASGQEVVAGTNYLDGETDCLQNADLKLLLELSSNSGQDTSMRSEPDFALMPEEMMFVTEYAEDIHRNLRESEIRFRPSPGYLKKHPKITNGMRVILVDWLVEVVHEYSLRSETLHLAINYLDRFLSFVANVKQGKLQLVGIAALLIASKYEENLPPTLNEFVYTTDSAYTKKQLISMEHVFLKVLAFNMAAPTPNQFLHLFMSIHSVCANTENLARYVAELSLLEIDPFLQYTPSVVAAGAYCLAAYTVNRSLWPDSLHTFTGYTIADIGPCVTDLHKLYISAHSYPQQTIRKKYKSLKYCHVSFITPPAVLPFL